MPEEIPIGYQRNLTGLYFVLLRSSIDFQEAQDFFLRSLKLFFLTELMMSMKIIPLINMAAKAAQKGWKCASPSCWGCLRRAMFHFCVSYHYLAEAIGNTQETFFVEQGLFLLYNQEIFL